MINAQKSSVRLYKDVAQRIVSEIAAGELAIGDRLPAERELAIQYDVSRPTIREAIIALEVQGLVEVRVGSGVYVRALSATDAEPLFDVSAIELTEARMLIEAEVAAMAATQISEEELAQLDSLVERIAAENRNAEGTELADREFHHAIAQASRNNALIKAVDELWEMRGTSPEAALLHEKARSANIKPVVEEHAAIVEALRARDPAAARQAMRSHLAQVLESLLFATEQRAVEAARRSVQDRRDRYSRMTA